MRKLTRFKNLALVILLLSGIATCQFYSDRARASEPKPSPFIPSPSVIRVADLGLHSAAASYYWLAAIQYLGDWQEDGYQKLSNFLSVSTELDPKFSHPYAFGVLILPSLNQFDQAAKLGEKGLKEADADWEIPYYLGTAYHMYRNDSQSAAKYFDMAAKVPGAPDNVAWIAANYGSRPDIRGNTILIWQNIAENSKDDEVKKRAEAYVYHFELMNFLEKAAADYKLKNGSYPEPIDKLVEGKVLKEIPVDPFGYQFRIDETGRAIIRF